MIYMFCFFPLSEPYNPSNWWANYVIKKNVKRGSCATIELLMHLGGLLSTPETIVALRYRVVQLLRFFRA